MNCSWSDIELGWRLGSIDSMTKEAIEVAKLLNTRCTFEFNGVTVAVNNNSNWEKVAHAALIAINTESKYVSVDN